MDPLHPLVIIAKVWVLETAFVGTFMCVKAIHRLLRIDPRPLPAARLVSRLGWRRETPRAPSELSGRLIGCDRGGEEEVVD